LVLQNSLQYIRFPEVSSTQIVLPELQQMKKTAKTLDPEKEVDIIRQYVDLRDNYFLLKKRRSKKSAGSH
jgi:hypothetical protein